MTLRTEPATRPAPGYPLPPPHRRLFCNRTLNLRAIRAVGYDMDYTLLHYKVEEWERGAYESAREKLQEQGWPVESLRFDPELFIRGLVLDTELGNIVKANRFGYVKRAFHGTRPMDFATQRRTYARILVDLHEERYLFLNTLFSLSEACLYAQLVDLLEERKLPEPMGYHDLYREVKAALDEAHLEGRLKAEIVARPERFVELDPETPLALLDQRRAGKKLLLITNSEWSYTQPMMRYAFDRFLPRGMGWRDLFDVVIVSARKPEFFSSTAPLFEVVDHDGLLRPSRALRPGGTYLGGNASLVEEHLGISGDQILFVGDHLYGDVHVTKRILRWRTVLILRELEEEIAAVEAFGDEQRRLAQLMEHKERCEWLLCQARLSGQRDSAGDGPAPEEGAEEPDRRMEAIQAEIAELDEDIAPLARASSRLSNSHWGLLMRTGNDKSFLTRQVERYADVYTSRVSNLLYATPFVFLRSPRGSLPHDRLVSTQPTDPADENAEP